MIAATVENMRRKKGVLDYHSRSELNDGIPCYPFVLDPWHTIEVLSSLSNYAIRNFDSVEIIFFLGTIVLSFLNDQQNS